MHLILAIVCYFSTAHDISTTKKTLVMNQVYELRKKVYETKQKGMPVSAYYSELQTSWHKLDYYQDFAGRLCSRLGKV